MPFRSVLGLQRFPNLKVLSGCPLALPQPGCQTPHYYCAGSPPWPLSLYMVSTVRSTVGWEGHCRPSESLSSCLYESSQKLFWNQLSQHNTTGYPFFTSSINLLNAKILSVEVLPSRKSFWFSLRWGSMACNILFSIIRLQTFAMIYVRLMPRLSGFKRSPDLGTWTSKVTKL